MRVFEYWFFRISNKTLASLCYFKWQDVLFEIPPKDIIRENPRVSVLEEFQTELLKSLTLKLENMLWPEVLFVTLNYLDDYKLRAPYRSLKSLNCQVVNS